MNPQEKAQCVEWFIETKSNTQVKRRFRTTYHKTPPSIPLIRAWYKQFQETGSVLHKKGTGCPRVSDENVERIYRIFVRSQRLSTRAAARELQMPHSTAHRVLRKHLRLRAYKLQVVQAITTDDRVAR
jgi:transposase